MSTLAGESGTMRIVVVTVLPGKPLAEVAVTTGEATAAPEQSSNPRAKQAVRERIWENMC
ncbi:hypothetical protein [Accumulibacter sp.]|uniref:hypothetical protein n=1 Tax=Accumulibacter sp. TaxID=2053492 RepID=UPI002619D5E3|nr:hypothetical protein [Accumulibacter sp.]MDS4055473.1 hypothetical protein [Accumulibacter sp.]